MKKRLPILFALAVLLWAQTAAGQANGRLQIHFMDVGQGDGALLISPLGEVVLFDDGALYECDKPLAYLQGLGITQIDYHIASHYHADHIGCADQILQQVPLQKAAVDRGGSYTTATYRRYVAAVGALRATAATGMTITLDAASPNPVRIVVAAVNADGLATTDENSLSLSAVIQFGAFRAEIGGDLTGTQAFNAVDVETLVALRVGPLDVYKVHHHCSRYSTNAAWLAATTPTVAIVSVGNENSYGHPTPDCLDRLHAVGTKTYWTEFGAGAEPDPTFDIVGGTIVVETVFAPSGQTFTVSFSGAPPDLYLVRGS